MDAYAHLPCLLPLGATFRIHAVNEVPDLHGGMYHTFGMAIVRHGNAARAHVGVADGLDLLQTVLLDDLVEGPETIIQFRNHFLRGEPVGDDGETFEIREQDGDALIKSRRSRSRLLQLLRHLGRQDVQQEAFDLGLLAVQDLVGLDLVPVVAIQDAGNEHDQEEPPPSGHCA